MTPQESGRSGCDHPLVSMLMSDSDSAAEDLPAESLRQCLDSFRACVGSDEVKKQEEQQSLSSLVVRCAEAAAANDLRKAQLLIRLLRGRVSPSGTGAERLAHYFTEALAARVSGERTSPPSHQYSIQKFYRTYKVAAQSFPIIGLCVFFTNQTILNHTVRAKRIHIVVYGIEHGFQWLCLLKDLSQRPGGPPELRLTGVDFPDHHMSVPAQYIAAGLVDYAEQCGVPFRFHSVVSADWDLVSPSELGVRDPAGEKDETLIVTGIYRLRQMRDDPCVEETARKRLLRQIASMKPAVFIQAEFPLSSNSEGVEVRVRDGLEFYTGMFGAIEEIFPEEEKKDEREFMEWIHGMDVMNMVAFEGEERIERPECYKMWQIVAQQAGLRSVKLPQLVYCKASEMVSSYKGEFSVGKSGNWLLIKWKHYLLSAITAWSPKEMKVKFNL